MSCLIDFFYTFFLQSGFIILALVFKKSKQTEFAQPFIPISVLSGVIFLLPLIVFLLQKNSAAIPILCVNADITMLVFITYILIVKQAR